MRQRAYGAVKRKVRFSRLAQADLIALHAWIEAAAGIEIADAYQARIEARCLSLADFPHRGSPRDYLLPDLRSLSFERRIQILYLVEEDAVRIRRVLGSAQEMGPLLS